MYSEHFTELTLTLAIAFFSSSTYPDTFIISILSFKAPGIVSVILAVHINSTCNKTVMANPVKHYIDDAPLQEITQLCVKVDQKTKQRCFVVRQKRLTRDSRLVQSLIYKFETCYQNLQVSRQSSPESQSRVQSSWIVFVGCFRGSIKLRLICINFRSIIKKSHMPFVLREIFEVVVLVSV